MKKLQAAVGLIVFAALTLSGCIQKKAVTSSVMPSRKAIKIGYAQVGHESAWREANTKSFKDTFTKENGYELTFVDADGSQAAQISAVRDFIRQNVDYIVIAPVVETGWDEVLKEAKEAAIPVILSDRQMELEDDNLYLCWVGGNFLKEAQDGVKWLSSYLENKNLETEDINIVNIQGTIGASAQIGRTQGIMEGVQKHHNWNLIGQATGDFCVSGGKSAMKKIIREVGIEKINAVFAENDDMALGVIEAIKEAGKKPGDDIIIISFDACNAAFKKMIDGEINCDCECNPLHGPRVAEIINKMESGYSIEKTQYVAEAVFDQSNASVAMPTRLY